MWTTRNLKKNRSISDLNVFNKKKQSEKAEIFDDRNRFALLIIVNIIIYPSIIHV